MKTHKKTSTKKPETSSQLPRLNQLIAKSGKASRRKADELIQQGRVTIDGRLAKLGERIDPTNHLISVDGTLLEGFEPENTYVLFHKPVGIVTTNSDPKGRTTVREFFPTKAQLFPVGRLDYDAEGLLIMTNDGQMAHRLMHPRYEVPKTYRVKVTGTPSAEAVRKLRKGVTLEDGRIRPKSIEFEKTAKENTWYKITVTEGRHHLIKRMWLRVGFPVKRLVRTELGPVKLGTLSKGQGRDLTKRELTQLRELVGL